MKQNEVKVEDYASGMDIVLERAEGTFDSIITVDEKSDNDKRHHTVTTTPTFIEKPTNLLLAHE